MFWDGDRARCKDSLWAASRETTELCFLLIQVMVVMGT